MLESLGRIMQRTGATKGPFPACGYQVPPRCLQARRGRNHWDTRTGCGTWALGLRPFPRNTQWQPYLLKAGLSVFCILMVSVDHTVHSFTSISNW